MLLIFSCWVGWGKIPMELCINPPQNYKPSEWIRSDFTLGTPLKWRRLGRIPRSYPTLLVEIRGVTCLWCAEWTCSRMISIRIAISGTGHCKETWVNLLINLYVFKKYLCNVDLDLLTPSIFFWGSKRSVKTSLNLATWDDFSSRNPFSQFPLTEMTWENQYFGKKQPKTQLLMEEILHLPKR